MLRNEESNTYRQRPIQLGVAIIVMGVSGSGKSTLAAQLSRAINAEFHDADDYHDPDNIVKMREGVALTDEDRAPWLARLNALLREHANAGRGIVLACSALKESYREAMLRDVSNAQLVFLDGDFETIAARMRERSATTAHYMPEALLQSQFEALERPADAIVIDVNLSPDAQLACAIASL
ncbi:MAG: gluconokinase [Casimicrobium sp.]